METKETEGIPWLRKIKENIIADSLIPYSEVENLLFIPTRRETLYKIIEYNKKSRFPRYDHLSKERELTSCSIRMHIASLKKVKLAFNVTILELCKVFSERRGKMMYLPKPLDDATWNDMSKRRVGITGGIASWRKRENILRPPNWPHYNLALIEKNGIPPWRDAFRFLKHYEAVPKI